MQTATIPAAGPSVETATAPVVRAVNATSNARVVPVTSFVRETTRAVMVNAPTVLAPVALIRRATSNAPTPIVPSFARRVQVALRHVPLEHPGIRAAILRSAPEVKSSVPTESPSPAMRIARPLRLKSLSNRGAHFPHEVRQIAAPAEVRLVFYQVNWEFPWQASC